MMMAFPYPWFPSVDPTVNPWPLPYQPTFIHPSPVVQPAPVVVERCERATSPTLPAVEEEEEDTYSGGEYEMVNTQTRAVYSLSSYSRCLHLFFFCGFNHRGSGCGYTYIKFLCSTKAHICHRRPSFLLEFVGIGRGQGSNGQGPNRLARVQACHVPALVEDGITHHQGQRRQHREVTHGHTTAITVVWPRQNSGNHRCPTNRRLFFFFHVFPFWYVRYWCSEFCFPKQKKSYTGSIFD